MIKYEYIILQCKTGEPFRLDGYEFVTVIPDNDLILILWRRPVSD